MALLTKEQVRLSLNSKQSHVIHELQEEHAKLLMHVHGIGTAAYLTQIDGLEDDKKILLRKKYARSNKDLFADILGPTYKIFNSQGGSKSYDVSNDNDKKRLLDTLSCIVDGYSLTQWEQSFLIDKLVTDPNGLFFVEHKDGKPYPTYKSISSIWDYRVSGRGVDWVIFKPVEVEENGTIVKKVRVYDDAFDYTYKLDGDSISLIEEETFKNPWGYVPAFTCSDKINPLTGFKKSPIYEQVELADEYLRDNSIKSIAKKLHGFPKSWMYAPSCKVCNGTGFKDGKICPACGGSKHSLKTDVSDVILLKQPESTDSPTIAPDVMGYVVPPIDSLRYLDEDSKTMRDAIYFSHWHTVINRDETQKTAFEVALNTQPMQDRLNEYTSSLENTEKYFVDIIGEFIAGSNYKSCSINYGRNYIILSPNQYLTDYLDEKSKAASYSVLNGKLEMYYNALYANDEMSRTYHLKLMQVEPLVHNSTVEVVGMDIDLAIKNQKVIFNEWLSQTKREDVISKEIPELQKSLAEYANTKFNKTTLQ